ncbi:MAG TPA: RES family NAD+ phosphorylase [Methylomirabilota bacterium]|nr:RES family NAD+ phosphorylase [Methylomirabilota bacterium]
MGGVGLMRHVRRAGRYHRVADPAWEDPLSGEFSRVRGGRWNAPGTFPIVYLNRDLMTARAFVRQKFRGQPYGPELLRDDRAPVLVTTEVPDDDYIDALSDEGCRELGLPITYPRDDAGKAMPWQACQPIGRRAWDAGEPGIACRSAALPEGGEELAYFSRPARPLVAADRLSFRDWFWADRRGGRKSEP